MNSIEKKIVVLAFKSAFVKKMTSPEQISLHSLEFELFSYYEILMSW